MNRKGFTLVELLVCIVVLSLVMVLVATSAFQAMNKAKVNAMKTYTIRLIEKAKERCITENCIDGTTYTAEDLMGKNSKKGYTATLTMSDTGKDYNVSGSIISNDKKIVASVVKNEVVVKNYSKGFKVYKAGTPIYYNPVDNVKCSEAEELLNRKENGTVTYISSGCMKWYVIETDDNEQKNNVDVILDHDIARSFWNGFSGLIEYERSAVYSYVKTLDDSIEEEGKGWSTELNPRLITADEIAKIIGAASEDTIKWSSDKEYKISSQIDIDLQVSGIYLDGGGNANVKSYSSSDGWNKQFANSTNQSNYYWLYDNLYNCKSYGCKKEEEYSNGYWTKTIIDNDDELVWGVTSSGRLVALTALLELPMDGGPTGVKQFDSKSGIRPVVTISKLVIAD